MSLGKPATTRRSGHDTKKGQAILTDGLPQLSFYLKTFKLMEFMLPRLAAIHLIYIYKRQLLFLCQSDDVAHALQRDLDGGFLVHVLLVE